MIYVPSRMGQLNRRALLRQLQKLGVASRAELAKALGMSQPTAGKIVDELIAMDVLEEVAVSLAEPGERDGGDAIIQLGRPGRMLRLNQSRAKFLAIQLGVKTTTVTGLTLGMVDADRWQFAFEVANTETAPARAWEKKLRATAKAFGTEDFMGVLLSVPGVVDETANRILFSPNIHWTETADLAAIVRRVWNVPVLLVQEERALALGHQLANPGCEDFMLVDFGEGVGGAIIIEGKPLANPLPISGEIGHTPVPGNRRPCGCGATGCMETLVSRRGLLESFSAAGAGRENSWPELCESISRTRHQTVAGAGAGRGGGGDCRRAEYRRAAPRGHHRQPDGTAARRDGISFPRRPERSDVGAVRRGGMFVRAAPPHRRPGGRGH